MTQQEFDKTKFEAFMVADYDGVQHWISRLSGTERLLGLVTLFDNPQSEDAFIIWVRCESVENVRFADQGMKDLHNSLYPA